MRVFPTSSQKSKNAFKHELKIKLGQVSDQVFVSVIADKARYFSNISLRLEKQAITNRPLLFKIESVCRFGNPVSVV